MQSPSRNLSVARLESERSLEQSFSISFPQGSHSPSRFRVDVIAQLSPVFSTPSPRRFMSSSTLPNIQGIRFYVVNASAFRDSVKANFLSGGQERSHQSQTVTGLIHGLTKVSGRSPWLFKDAHQITTGCHRQKQSPIRNSTRREPG